MARDDLFITLNRSDIWKVHKILGTGDMPPVVRVERRHQPERRTFWRGGRRNADWMHRPIGAWRSLEQRLSPVHQWIATILPRPRHRPSSIR